MFCPVRAIHDQLLLFLVGGGWMAGTGLSLREGWLFVKEDVVRPFRWANSSVAITRIQVTNNTLTGERLSTRRARAMCLKFSTVFALVGRHYCRCERAGSSVFGRS
jgi:hypothetical protein